jgi:L-2-hydroxyglutarate oxidase
MNVDFLVVGGGIVGVSSAMQILQDNPGKSLVLLEKEAGVARHQTGRNSGVIHAGIYYQPGSLKAQFCRVGSRATVAFCEKHDIPYERCGKLLVATTPLEMERMAAIEARSALNEITVERLDAAQLKEREPNVAGLGALFVPASGIVNYGQVTRAMAAEIERMGGEIRFGAEAASIVEDADAVTVEAGGGTFRARTVVVCAGLHADRLARMAGLDPAWRVVPFRGEYYELPESKWAIVKHLIYPIPDPSLPFLGVHLTKIVDGRMTVGPNAVLAFAREGYSKTAFNPGDIAEMASFPGFWKLMRKHLKSGFDEQLNSLSKERYAALCRKYCPDITADDLLPYPSGVRAQVVMPDGTLLHDFMIEKTRRMVHVCNAPSPAATSALPIGRKVADEVAALQVN